MSTPSLARRAMRRIDPRRDPYVGPVASTIRTLAGRVFRREMTVEALLDEIGSTYDETDMAAEFDRFSTALPAGVHAEQWLGPGRHEARMIEEVGRWSRARGMSEPVVGLQLFHLPPNSAEPPHGHHASASLQHVLRGTVHCRQYERVRAAENGAVVIQPHSRHEFGPGQRFRMTEHETNVHWFGTGAEPAVVLDFYIGARGLYETPFDAERSPNRCYLDPTGVADANGMIHALPLDEAEAVHRFAGHSPLAFDWPA